MSKPELKKTENKTEGKVTKKDKQIVIGIIIGVFILSVISIIIFFIMSLSAFYIAKDEHLNSRDSGYSSGDNGTQSTDGIADYYDSNADYRADQKYVSYTSIDDMEKKLSKGDFDGVIYLGRHTCPACKVFRPKLNNAIKETGVKVYYVNTEVARGEDSEAMNHLQEELDVTGVPVMIKLENGKEIDRLEGGGSTESEIADWLNKK